MHARHLSQTMARVKRYRHKYYVLTSAACNNGQADKHRQHATYVRGISKHMGIALAGLFLNGRQKGEQEATPLA